MIIIAKYTRVREKERNDPLPWTISAICGKIKSISLTVTVALGNVSYTAWRKMIRDNRQPTPVPIVMVGEGLQSTPSFVRASLLLKRISLVIS